MPLTEAIDRIKKYCANAEKCSHDVVTKLEEWGLDESEIQTILTTLKAQGFVDDERYAKSYVSEKRNLDKWGRIKIANTLQQKQIEDSVIDSAISEIDDHEYIESLHEILLKKYREVKSDDPHADAKRIMMHAASKGYEEELIEEWLHKNLPLD